MIKSFADRYTWELFEYGMTKRLPPTIVRRAARKLDYLHYAVRLEDLKTPPGNRLHVLRGSRLGQYAISINGQWRICFRFIDGNAYDVEICDYH